MGKLVTATTRLHTTASGMRRANLAQVAKVGGLYKLECS
jgi:hypothetical protein